MNLERTQSLFDSIYEKAQEYLSVLEELKAAEKEHDEVMALPVPLHPTVFDSPEAYQEWMDTRDQYLDLKANTEQRLHKLRMEKINTKDYLFGIIPITGAWFLVGEGTWVRARVENGSRVVDVVKEISEEESVGVSA